MKRRLYKLSLLLATRDKYGHNWAMKLIETSKKTCVHCGSLYERGRMRSGRIEAIEDWEKRKFCGLACAFAHNSGTNHYAYVDGIRKGHDCGYLRNSKGKYIHRIVMSEKLGRPLLSSEHVHHIDGNVLNNEPNNLELLSNSEHRRDHAKRQQRNERGAFCSGSA